MPEIEIEPSASLLIRRQFAAHTCAWCRWAVSPTYARRQQAGAVGTDARALRVRPWGPFAARTPAPHQPRPLSSPVLYGRHALDTEGAQEREADRDSGRSYSRPTTADKPHLTKRYGSAPLAIHSRV
jgi:hypothetical protein